ncbi:MAG: DNA methyltransferase [Promethearchaeia archaeon]
MSKAYHSSELYSNFYQEFLRPFFVFLSEKSPSERSLEQLPRSVIKLLEKVPALGFNIFKRKPTEKKDIFIPDELLFELLEEFLEKYKFTCEERLFDDTKKKDISPSILGDLFELALIEGDRESAGIFFTPKVEVDLMTKYSLYEYLLEMAQRSTNELQKKEVAEGLHSLFFTSLNEWEGVKSNQSLKIFMKDCLDRVSIIDPACGSGDFLIGVFRNLIKLYQKFGINTNLSLLLKLLTVNLYGVDIQHTSIEIAQVRLYLFLLSELNAQSIPSGRLNFDNIKLNLKSGNALTQSFSKFFPEIMGQNEGFDIVIGNPPYIRQEKLYYQDTEREKLSNLNKEQLKESRDKYKKFLQSYVKSNFRLSTGKTCDIYVYFYFKALDILKPGGIFAFLTSNTWLDSNFGETLQEGLLRFAQLKYLINNHKEKSFEDADINTIITVGAKKEEPHLFKEDVHFINIYIPYESFHKLNISGSIFHPTKRAFHKFPYSTATIWFKDSETYKHIIISESDLWKISGASLSYEDTETPSEDSDFPKAGEGYELFKWSKFLRAPLIYFQIYPAIESHFSAIGQKYKRGYTTGANAFFYLPVPSLDTSHTYFKTEMDEKTGNLLVSFKNSDLRDKFGSLIEENSDSDFIIERSYWMRECKEYAGKDFPQVYYDTETEMHYIPNYLIKSPKELDQLIITPHHLKLIVLHINSTKKALSPGILNYIKWGESMDFHERPTCSSRHRWYDLSVKVRKPIVCIIDVHERYVFSFNKYRFDIDARLYGLDFGDDYINRLNFLLLKSTLYPLLMELEGRLGLGDGALDLKLCDYEHLPLPAESVLDRIDSSTIDRLFAKISQDDFANQTIFDTLNSDDPEDVSIHKLDEFIDQIDEIVFEEILGLRTGQRIKLYKALLHLVEDRIHKSQT